MAGVVSSVVPLFLVSRTTRFFVKPPTIVAPAATVMPVPKSIEPGDDGVAYSQRTIGFAGSVISSAYAAALEPTANPVWKIRMVWNEFLVVAVGAVYGELA